MTTATPCPKCGVPTVEPHTQIEQCADAQIAYYAGERQAIDDGMIQWDPGTLSTTTVRRILRDALADLWQDCYRQNQHDGQRGNLFREVVMAEMLAATDNRFLVVKG